MPKRILITGGHITPALAVIDEWRRGNNIDVVFVGRKYNNNDNSLSFEYKEIQKRDIPFFHLEAGRLTRKLNRESIWNMVKAPIGLYSASRVLSQTKPDCILSFGGYLALPIAYMAGLQNIPVYTHEQTIAPGLSNQMISSTAKKVFVSFPETLRDNDPKHILTGNPLRKEIFHTGSFNDIQKTKPLIYITGGSLGSHSLNLHIEQILAKLLQSYQVIHQTGSVEMYHDFERLQALKNSLPPALGENYFPFTHISTNDIGKVYNLADIVISRSGANTFFELVALKKPSVLVPLPWSARGEQQQHAEILREAGVAEVFSQNEEAHTLLTCINRVFSKRENYRSNFVKLNKYHIHNAAQNIINEIKV